MNYFLDCVEDSLEEISERVLPISHVMLMDMTDINTVTQKVRSLAWIITKRLDSNKIVRNGRGFFFRQKGLYFLGKTGNVTITELRETFRECLAWDHGRTGKRIQKLWN